MRRGPALLLIAAIAATAVLAQGLVPAPGSEVATITVPDGTLHLAVADEPGERREGLMNRTAVPRDGMLFVFPDEQRRIFWMKHTRIPLDMVFVAGDGTVLNVEQAAVPTDPSSPEARYRSDGPAKYVIELEQGDAARYGIRRGVALDIALP